MNAQSSADLLIEIGTEELPPKALAGLAQAFRDDLVKALDEARLGHGDARCFATPRRLAVMIETVSVSQPDEQIKRRGPAVQAAFDQEGQPTKAALGFARSCGVDFETLGREEGPKGTWLSFEQTRKGESATQLLASLIEKALATLPIPKRMRWGAGEVEFVRPVHWVCGLLGEAILPGQILGVSIDRLTRGHRFLAPEPREVHSPGQYLETLRAANVEPDLDVRRNGIRKQVDAKAAEIGGTALVDAGVLDEVVALCEWPQAFVGTFDADFLEVPPEVLIETMQANQKYFPVLDEKDGLRPFFIGVSNIESLDPQQVTAGNERVIRPRFADARFFWEQDQQRPLSERQAALEGIVFQHQLGSLQAKTTRVVRLSQWIANRIGTDADWAGRAAALAKCDLVTLMVGEFGSLQGLMGRYYALASGENETVAAAIEQHYWPKHAGDRLPEASTAQAVALADRIDTLVGIFAIGQKPTGVKDPYGLRRAAIAVLRILIEIPLPLDLRELLQEGANGYQGVIDAEASVDEVFAYCMDRLKGYYGEPDSVRTARPDVLASVLALGKGEPLDIDRRVQAVQAFRSRPEAVSLAAANKRTRNILRKAGDVTLQERIDPALLVEASEQQLAKALEEKTDAIAPLLQASDYAAVLAELAGLHQALDGFFDAVMVMDENPTLRANRLAILKQIERLFLNVADLSLLQS